MAEIVGLVASIFAVIQIADRVTTLGYEFYGKVKGPRREVMEMIATVSALKTILELLHRFVVVDENALRLPLFQSLCQPEGPLKECEEMLDDIESRIRLKREHSGKLKSITWPWQWEEMAKKLKTIERHKQTFTLALQGDMATKALEIQDTVNEVHAFAKEGRDTAHAIRRDLHSERDFKIIKWLATTDPNTNHSAARQKWEPGTGEWFLSSNQFVQWLQPRKSLWLHGIPGAGKTILCSTIIENVRARCSGDDICAFFYFDSISGEATKQTVSAMLSSLLAQISTVQIEPEVRRLYEQCENGSRSPSLDEISKTILMVLCKGQRVYLIVDALDECSERSLLLQVIQQILQIDCDVHLMLTSRKEYDIETTLQASVTAIVSMEDKRVDPDIHIHVEQCLREDPKLCKWDEKIKQEIVTELVSGAKGMYDILRHSY
jgi:NACHT domain